MTGADLANLVNEAALLAARRIQDAVSQRDLTDADDGTTVSSVEVAAKIGREQLRDERGAQPDATCIPIA